MTDLLEKAFGEAARLPEEKQDKLAAWILEEMESERRWARSFDRSADALSRLADNALAERRVSIADTLLPRDVRDEWPQHRDPSRHAP